MSVTLGELARSTGAELQGDPDFVIHNIATPEKAVAGEMSCIFSRQYLELLQTSKASVLVVTPQYRDQVKGHALFHENPYLVYAKASRFFSPYRLPEGVHQTAAIDPEADIADDVRIGANAVIEAGAVIGKGCVIGGGSYVGARVVMGENCHLRPNVTLLEDTRLGRNVLIHSGTVIGDDGFGFAPSEGRWHHIEQLGHVVIGDDTEIGTNCAIDRGALEATEIGEGVIIDNLVHIAHNVKVGDFSAIAGCVAIAGSTSIGKHCQIAGAVGIAGHLTIADGVTIMAMSRVAKSIKQPDSSWSSGTNATETPKWRRNTTRFNQLDEMAKRLRELEKKINKMTTNTE